jgi:hypothetical protein
MKKYARLIILTIVGLFVFLLFMLYQELKLTDGGFTSSPKAAVTLPLIVQTDVSLLAFWGFMLVFRFTELSSIRTELIKNLWDIGFKIDELKVKIAEVKEDGTTKNSLMKLYEELRRDAKLRRKTIEEYYDAQTIITFVGLLAAAFLVASVSSGLYGISLTFHTELIDPFTYFAPIVCLFIGVMLIIYTLLASVYKLTEELEIRQ